MSSLPVHNVDTGLSYATLQEALDANESIDGHTIRVDVGIYYEHVLVNKSISLIGENSETTIIDGGGVGNVVSIVSDSVTLSCFTIRNGYFGIYLGSLYNSIIGNRLTDNEIAIRTESHSNFNRIARNEITGNFRGVFLASYNNNVTENKIDHNQYGIYLTSIASGNRIVGNNVTQNEHAIYFFASSENLVFHNNFLNNQGQVGIWGEGATYHNMWNGSYPIGGNYWSDYNGNDSHTGELQNLLGSDGIGDIPYLIDRLNCDNFPLMHIFSPLFCDLNQDRKVDIKDVALASTSFGSSVGQTKWNPDSDVNSDGSVDIKDLVQIAKNFGNIS